MSNTIKNIVISILFGVILLLVLIMNLIKKDDLISLSERRNLTQLPSFSINSMLDKTLFDNFDKYTTDQFIYRDNFRYLKAMLDLDIKNNYHNLYLKGDYIIEQIYPININSINNLTNKITFIKDKYLTNNNIYFSIIPDKNYFVNDNNLRIDYDLLKSIMINNLSYAKYIDIFNELDLTDYYKTDSHWKVESIVNVSNKLLSSMNNYNVVNYNTLKVTSFKGVYAYQLPISSNEEDINILTNDSINNSYVIHLDTNKITNIYDMNKINSLDKYDIYLSGSTPLLTIHNDNIKDRELIVFRDSFGSSLIPLLVSSYSKITVIDTRYINPKILDNYIDINNQDVLFIYNVSIINNSYSLK